MATGLATPTICKVDEVNPVDMKYGEDLGAGLGVRALVSGVVADLEDMTGFPEGRFLEIRAIPLL